MTVHVVVTAPMLAAYDYFLAVGFTKNGAAAPVGNGCQESGEFLVATMFRAHPDWSGGVPEALKSGGFEEWLGDRKTACIAFIGRAEQRLGVTKGSLLNDLGTQCAFVVYELQTNERYATLYQQLTTGSRSIANLTANFMAIYEVPALKTANLDNRISHAEAVAARAAEIKAQPAPIPAPPAPIPQVPVSHAKPPVIPAPIPHPTPPGGPISASAAGRQLAVLDTLEEMRTAYLAERAAIDMELGIIETTIADFGKLAPLPAPSILLPEAAKSAAPQPQRTGIMDSQISAAIRNLLIFAGGTLVSTGYVDNATLVSVVGGIVSLGGAAWSAWGHKTTNVIAAAASLPEVQKIVTTAAIADSAKFATNNRVVAH
jgi:hypothetical protein